MKANRLIVVSNRLPLVVSRSAAGDWRTKAGSGGLVTALMPVLRDRGGVWIGWAGLARADTSDLKRHLQEVTREFGYSFEPVGLTRKQVQGFYEGFSNEIVWPLFHDLLDSCKFEPSHWRSYVEVNETFADAIARMATAEDVLWVHDYHLMGVAKQLRRRQVSNKIGFFLHIPFPTPDMFMRMPWRLEVLSDLLEYNLIGFQTLRDRRHFLRCLRMLFDVKTSGSGQVQDINVTSRTGTKTWRLRIGCFPISIDYKNFAENAASARVTRAVDELGSVADGRHVILSVDRLDYTKGILTKLEAFRLALQQNPEMIREAVLWLHVVPSREDLPQYQQLRLDIEQRVSEINGEFSQPGFIPIHYYYQSLPRPELIAQYRVADVMLVSPFKDGMNLVAKEYCACQTNDDGVLILSEFAGSAAELQGGALLVNPHDVEGIADAIQQAIKMERAERAERMKELKSKIREHDIFSWVNGYLRALSGQDLSRFPTGDDYSPSPVPLRQVSGL